MTKTRHLNFARVARVVCLTAALGLVGCASQHSRVDGSSGARAPIVVHPTQRKDVVLTALGLLQEQYRYGGMHPETGFDCSGLVAFVFSNAASQPLPHNTAQIAHLSRPVRTRDLQAGDFVFFNTLNRPNSHMGIYIGDDQFVNAPSSGGVVRIDSLKNPYFAKRFESARTLFGS